MIARHPSAADGDGLPPASGPGEQHLYRAQLPFEETTLAVAEVVFPEPDEGIPEAEFAHPGQVAEEPFTPAPQRARVVRPDVFQVKNLEVAGAGHRGGHGF